MIEERKQHPAPMRIELATSESEGGGYLSWADPQQVIACVAAPHPADTFGRFIEPRLADLDRGPAPTRAADSPQLPPRVMTLLDRIRQVHVRLYRENRSAPRDTRTAHMSVALVEESRVFFVKGTPCSIFIVREGGATLAFANGSDTVFPALGESERLPLSVTSVEVLPHDVVVLLVAEGGQAPDRVAIAQAFQQSADLKRACDGLVGLLGLASTGVGVVAMRFVPIGAASDSGVDGSDVIEDLERELARRFPGTARAAAPAPAAGPAQAAAPAPGAGPMAPNPSAPTQNEVPLPAFLEELDPSPASGPRPGPGRPASAEEASMPLPAFLEEAGKAPPVELPAELIAMTERTAGDIAAPPAGGPPESKGHGGHGGPSEPPHGHGPAGPELPPPPRRKTMTAWAVSFGIVLTLLIGVIAIPRGVRLWRGSPAASCSLRVDPTPPARGIYVDGIDMRTGSPAVLEGLTAGQHTVRMDLGAFGLLEENVRLRAGETVDLRPRAFGILEVSATETREGARAWIPGRAPQRIPCRFDSIPVGPQDLFYEDGKIPLFQRQVTIRAGETLRVRIPNAIPSGRAMLRIESWRLEEGHGLVESSGDSLYIDGVYLAGTPWEGLVDPGLHGVRITGPDGLQWTEVVDLASGCCQVIAPRFGLDSWPQIEHREPGRVVARGPLLLTATIRIRDAETVVNPRLHLPGLDAAVRDLPLSPVDGEEGVYVAIVDPNYLPHGRPMQYFFTVRSGEGTVVSSELYQLVLVSEIS
jgi:hypothetical protein